MAGSGAETAENRGVREPAARLDVIDGMRGIAILLVFWFHLWQLSWLDPRLPVGNLTLDVSSIAVTGFLGVDLFFFLSGFCLFFPFARAYLDGTPPPRLGEFAYRRFIKIVPSYWLAIVGAILIGYAVFDSPLDAFGKVALHLLFIHPLFPDAFGSVSGVLWSLGVEVQFYLLFPLIAWALRRWPITTGALAFAIAAIDRFAVAHGDLSEGERLMDQLSSNIDLFVSGMLAAYLYRVIATRRVAWTRRPRAWTALAGAAAVAYALIARWLYLPRYDRAWPVFDLPSVVPMLDVIFVAFALGSLFGMTWWRRLIANRALVFFAAISYNLYLWHQVIAFELFRHRLIPFVGHDPHEDPVWRMTYSVVAATVAIGVATILTYGFERPLMRRRRVAPRRDVVPIGAPLPPA